MLKVSVTNNENSNNSQKQKPPSSPRRTDRRALKDIVNSRLQNVTQNLENVNPQSYGEGRDVPEDRTVQQRLTPRSNMEPKKSKPRRLSIDDVLQV